jgi:hypothetical protein
VKLDPVLCDRVLDAVRSRLPAGLLISRKGRGKLKIKSKPGKHEWAYAVSPAFSNISRRNTPGGAVAIGMERTLQAVSEHLRQFDQRWPGLEWGPVEISTDIQGDEVVGKIVDVTGTTLKIPPVRTS